MCLAYFLSKSPLKNLSVAILEKDIKKDRLIHWSFWTDKKHEFESIVYKRWNKAIVANKLFSKMVAPEKFEFQVIRNLDFFKFVKRRLRKLPDFKIMQTRVKNIESGKDFCVINTTDGVLFSRWVFDSIFNYTSIPKTSFNNYLSMSGVGWLVETPAHLFKENEVTLFDFLDKKDGLKIFYVLPFSPTKALIEIACIENSTSPKNERAGRQEFLLKEYAYKLCGQNYTITNEESGVIQMTDHIFARKISHRVMTIGRKAGMVKPTTSYAFTNIVKDSTLIVSSMVKNRHPFYRHSPGIFYKISDFIMITLMKKYPDSVPFIFEKLFKRIPVDFILGFLSEQNSFFRNWLLITLTPSIDIWKSIYSTGAFRLCRFMLKTLKTKHLT